MADQLNRDPQTGLPTPSPRRALAGVPVQNDNVSPAGDLTVALEDGAVAGRFLGIDSLGRIGVFALGDTNSLLLANLLETARLRQGLVLSGQCEDVSLAELVDDYGFVAE